MKDSRYNRRVMFADESEDARHDEVNARLWMKRQMEARRKAEDKLDSERLLKLYWDDEELA